MGPRIACLGFDHANQGWICSMESSHTCEEDASTILKILPSRQYDIDKPEELTASKVLLWYIMDNASDRSIECQSLSWPRRQTLKSSGKKFNTLRLIMYFRPSPLMFMVRCVYSTQWSISFSWVKVSITQKTPKWHQRGAQTWAKALVFGTLEMFT